MIPLLNTSWTPFGGNLLVAGVTDAPRQGTIIVPDEAKDTVIGIVQKASAPASSYFHPGDEVLFHLQGAIDIYLEDCREEAFIVTPKAVLLHKPIPRKRAEII